jgi:mono/diheme cytochrome c family protein
MRRELNRTQKTKGVTQKTGVTEKTKGVPSAYCLLPTVFCLLFTAACRRDMQDQPKMKPYRASTFFADQLSMRPPVEGTVARGFLRTDVEFFTGKKRTSAGATTTQPQPAAPAPSANATNPQGAAVYPDDIDYLPIRLDESVLQRGKERYEIFCSVCHGLTGNGDGMVVRRGFRRATSFHDDRLRQAPVGHFFDAITNGWGVMPSYAAQIPVQDRWAIVAYTRALQASQPARQGTPPSQTGGATSPTPSPTPSGGHQ